MFSVDNSSGQTTIRGGGNGSTVRVMATRHSTLGGQAPEVHLTPAGDGVRLEAAQPRGRFLFGGSESVDYSIELPASSNVTARSSSGTLSIADVAGEVRLSASSGRIDATGLRHLREATSSSGSMSLEGVFTDAAQIRASSGSVNLKLLPGSAVALDVKASSGSVVPRGGLLLSGGSTQRNRLTGALGAPAPGATLSIQTSSGSVYISQ